MYLSEAPGHDFDVKATAKGRGFSKEQKAYGREVVEAWGGPKRADRAHLSKPHVDTKQGETYRAGMRERTWNRRGGAKERAAGGGRSGAGGADPKAVAGARNVQPKPPVIQYVKPRPLQVGPAPAPPKPAAPPPAPPPPAPTTAPSPKAPAPTAPGKVVPLEPGPPFAEIPKAPKTPKAVGVSGAKALGAAGDALLLGQMATAATPEETHAVLADAVFVPIQLALTYSPTALIYKHVFGFDPMKLQIPFPMLPWSERAKFEAAAKRHGQTLAP